VPAGLDAYRQWGDWARLRPLEASMAKAMQASASIPIGAQWVDAPVDALLTRLRAAREDGGEGGDGGRPRITFTSVVVWASLQAAWDVEPMHFEYDFEGYRKRRRAQFGVSVATAGPRGLVVPTLWFDEPADLPTVAARLGDVAERARAGRITPDELQVGSMSVSSIGNVGLDGGFPTPRVGEVLILGVSSITDRPVVRDGAVVPGQVTTLTVTLDHRAIDGMACARFLMGVRDRLVDAASVPLPVPEGR
jgi:pyruvate/2-oxoglutarate dehydrogenase complex dihydrolipoamide acyltransferase (E2) component